jgi:O-antigen/teichoic acid export membrane protein
MSADPLVQADGAELPDAALLWRRIINNISALTLAQLLYRGVSLLLSIALARYLGVVQQGVYGQILNFVAVFGAFCDLGIANLVIRDMNQDAERPAQLASSYFGLLLLTNAALFVGAVGLALALGYDRSIVIGVALGAGGMAFGGVSSAFYAVLAGRQRMKRIAVIQTANTATIAAGMITTMATGGGVIALSGVATVAGACTLLFFLAPALRLLPELRLTLDVRAALALLRRGLPFTLHVGLYVVFTRIDVLILNAFSDGYTLGIYTAASRLTYPLTVFSMMAVTAVFPVMSQYVQRQPAVAFAVARAAQRWLVLGGVLIALAVSVFSGPLVRVLFGAEYAPTAPVLSVLIWYIPIFSSYQVVSDLLVAANRVWQLVAISVLSLALVVVLNIVLIPRYGAFGPAWATVACEALRAVAILLFAGLALGFHRTTRA